MFPERSHHHICLWLEKCRSQWLAQMQDVLEVALGLWMGKLLFPWKPVAVYFIPSAIEQPNLCHHSSRKSSFFPPGGSQRVFSNSFSLVALRVNIWSKCPNWSHLGFESHILLLGTVFVQQEEVLSMGLHLCLACDFVICKTEIRIKSTALSSNSLCQPSCCAMHMCLSQCSSH